MKIGHRDFDAAVKEGLLTKPQARKLQLFWQEQHKDVVSFRFTHILYYLGGLIAISAVTIYVTLAWEKVQGFPLLIFALSLLILGFGLTHKFLAQNLRIPAGIMSAFSLALVPLIVYNIQFLLGIMPHKPFLYTDFHTRIDWYWVNMELATLFVGFIMFYFYRFSFLFFPIAVILWYMSMDLWPLFFNLSEYDFTRRAIFSMIYGFIILLFAIYMDLKYDDEREDYAFWLYIVGVIIFWGGLSCQNSDSELSKFFYFLINLAMLFVGAVLNRRVFAVFGALGIIGYLSHLAFSVFANSLGFPIVMVFIGMLIICSGIFFTRIEGRLNQLMRLYIPKKILRKMER